MKYSEQQVDIFCEIEDSNRSLVISAVAGSGKSTTLFKIATLLEGQDVLFLAFNTHIAKYASAKLKKLPYVKVETTHAYGLSCIRHSAKFKRSAFEYSKVWNYIEANVSNFKLRSLFYHALNALRTFGCFSYTEKGVSNFMRENPEIINQIGDGRAYAYAGTIARMLKDLDAQTHCYDYNDMLRFPILYNLFNYGYIPKVLLVDEAQDMNIYLFKFLEHFLANDVRVISVGDENQSIYSFRGACGEAINIIKKMTNAKRMPLSTTYRCKSNIVRFIKKQYEALDYVPDIHAHTKGGKVVELVDTDQDEYCLKTLLQNNITMVVSAKNKHIISIWFLLLEQYGISSSLKGSNITTMLTKMFKTLKANRVPFKNIHAELRAQANSEDEVIADMAIACLRFVSIKRFDNYEQVQAKIKQIESDTTSKIHLFTVHSAKGMEAKKVFVIDDWFDSSQIDNMKYVGYSRASDELYVVKLRQKSKY